MQEATPTESLAEDQILRKRATRRLIVAVLLVVGAVIILTIVNLGRHSPIPTVPQPLPPSLTSSIDNAPNSSVTPSPEPNQSSATEATASPPTSANPSTPPPPPDVSDHGWPSRQELDTVPADVPPSANQKSADASPDAQSPAGQTAKPRPIAESPQAPAVIPKAFAVQAGVFSNPANAQDLQAKLARHGIRSYTETRLQLGPFPTREEAQQAVEKLRELSISAVIVPK